MCRTGRMTSSRAMLTRGHISLTSELAPTGVQVFQKLHIRVIIIVTPKKNPQGCKLHCTGKRVLKNTFGRLTWHGVGEYRARFSIVVSVVSLANMERSS